CRRSCRLSKYAVLPICSCLRLLCFLFCFFGFLFCFVDLFLDVLGSRCPVGGFVAFFEFCFPKNSFVVIGFSRLTHIYIQPGISFTSCKCSFNSAVNYW